jgi:hypothetical protein
MLSLKVFVTPEPVTSEMVVIIIKKLEAEKRGEAKTITRISIVIIIIVVVIPVVIVASATMPMPSRSLAPPLTAVPAVYLLH